MSQSGGVLFMLILVVLIFLLTGKSMRRSCGTAGTALDIRKQRFAQGEISREGFERMKQDIKD